MHSARTKWCGAYGCRQHGDICPDAHHPSQLAEPTPMPSRSRAKAKQCNQARHRRWPACQEWSDWALAPADGTGSPPPTNSTTTTTATTTQLSPDDITMLAEISTAAFLQQLRQKGFETGEAFRYIERLQTECQPQSQPYTSVRQLDLATAPPQIVMQEQYDTWEVIHHHASLPTTTGA